MVRLTFSRDEWGAIARELASPCRGAPPGLCERVDALLARAPVDWPDEGYALDLDAWCAEAVLAAHAAITGRDPSARERSAALVEAEAIVRDHQRPA